MEAGIVLLNGATLFAVFALFLRFESRVTRIETKLDRMCKDRNGRNAR